MQRTRTPSALIVILLASACGSEPKRPATGPIAAPPIDAPGAGATTAATVTPTATAPLAAPAEGPLATALANARGRAVPGKVVPEDVTLTWSKTGGNLVNCRGYVRNDDVEGDKSLSECKASQIAANGTATPWIPVAAADDNGADFSTYAVAADSDRRFFHVAERTSGSAVGACIDSHTGYARGPGGAREELSFLPTCELWAPRAFRAPRKGGEIFLLSGTDTEKFGIAYEHYQGEGSTTNPWQLLPAQRIFVQGTGPSPTVTKLTGSYPVDAIAATRDTLAIVGRPERDAKLEEARLTATVIPLPGGGTSTAVTLVVAAGKSDFGRPVAAATDAGFLVVWSERPREEQSPTTSQVPGSQGNPAPRCGQSGRLGRSRPAPPPSPRASPAPAGGRR